MNDPTEALQKAITEAAEMAPALLKKSQMSLDFGNPNPHHVAYTRTNQRGTVSNVKAKGSQIPQPEKAHDHYGV